MADSTPQPVPHDDPAAVHDLVDGNGYVMACGEEGPSLASSPDPADWTCAACITRRGKAADQQAKAEAAAGTL